jgi:hypothetical protein
VSVWRKGEIKGRVSSPHTNANCAVAWRRRRWDHLSNRRVVVYNGGTSERFKRQSTGTWGANRIGAARRILDNKSCASSEQRCRRQCRTRMTHHGESMREPPSIVMGAAEGGRTSVGQQGRIGGGAHGSARRTCERGGPASIRTVCWLLCWASKYLGSRRPGAIERALLLF